MWRGLTRKPLEDACAGPDRVSRHSPAPRHELIDLVEDTTGKITGAVLYDRANVHLVPMAAKATIIAAGGTGGCSSEASLPPMCSAPRRPSRWCTVRPLLI